MKSDREKPLDGWVLLKSIEKEGESCGAQAGSPILFLSGWWEFLEWAYFSPDSEHLSTLGSSESDCVETFDNKLVDFVATTAVFFPVNHL